MTVFENNWNYKVELTYSGHSEFDLRLGDQFAIILGLDGFKVQNYKSNGQNNDDELKSLFEQNRLLRSNISIKLEELAKQKTKYEDFRQDQKLLSQEIKDTHEAFLMAKKYYKKYLKIYYTIEAKKGDQQTIFLQFFTETKKDSDVCSIRLLRDTKTRYYDLLTANPKVSMIEDWRKILRGTNDVPAVICSIRQTFLKMKKK